MGANLVPPDLLGHLVQEMRNHNAFPMFLRHYEDGPGDLGALIAQGLEAVRNAITRMDSEQVRQEVASLSAFGGRIGGEAVIAGNRDAIEDFTRDLLMRELSSCYFDLTPYVLADGGLTGSLPLGRYPRLRCRVDRDDLVPVGGGVDFDDQYVYYRRHAFHFHPFFRRYFTSNVNFEFLRALRCFADQNPACKVAVAIDHRRMLDRKHVRRTYEKAFWWGVHFSWPEIDDPQKVGHAVYGYDEISPASYPVRKTEINLRMLDALTKQIEIEEVVDICADSLTKPFQNDSFVINRFVHGLRRIDEGRFVHLDGSARVYDKPAYDARLEGNLYEANVLRYVKLFRIDGPVPDDDWAKLICLYFRQNELIHEVMGRNVN